jgi:hypothetical protein
MVKMKRSLTLLVVVQEACRVVSEITQYPEHHPVAAETSLAG